MQRDPLTIFYRTLYEQVPTSDMAAIWWDPFGLQKNTLFLSAFELYFFTSVFLVFVNQHSYFYHFWLKSLRLLRFKIDLLLCRFYNFSDLNVYLDQWVIFTSSSYF